MDNTVILDTKYDDLNLFGKGKVRDIYDLDDKLLLIATDRISAFDHILPNGIPMKGKVLNKLSEFWFDETTDIVKNHKITTNTSDYPSSLKEHLDELADRSMIVKKTETFPVECVARGYISGSAWKEYQEKGMVCGIELTEGLKESEKIDNPIFTPATKAETGHDINISYEECVGIIGEQQTKELKEYTLKLYERACEIAESKGITIADTKFEFGILDGNIILIDEALTPDSSRFWPKDDYKPGRSQKSFDKQYVRDYLLEIGWDREPPIPTLPKEVIEDTSRKYQEAYSNITGKKL